jgi:hypothetical protein
MSLALILALFRYLTSGALLFALAKVCHASSFHVKLQCIRSSHAPLFPLQILKTLYLSPLRDIPGPKLAALTDLWMLRRSKYFFYID